ncbi:MAG: hypothetical protein PHG47_11050 [Sulfuricella sp.]|nr:hypothetical protein [Sulfuricella sp.]
MSFGHYCSSESVCYGFHRKNLRKFLILIDILQAIDGYIQAQSGQVRLAKNGHFEKPEKTVKRKDAKSAKQKYSVSQPDDNPRPAWLRVFRG